MGVLSLVKLGLRYAPKMTRGAVKAGHNSVRYAGYAKRGVKGVPNILFEGGADKFVKGASAAARSTIANNGSWWQAIKAAIKGGGRAVEGNVATLSKQGGFFKRMLTNIRSIPSVVKAGVKSGVAGKTTLRGKLWGGTKGLFGSLFKMPLVANLMLIAFELPNIISATKDKGVISGATETGKTAARLTGASIGSAALAGIPYVGPLVGWILGDAITSKVVGKSYSTKKYEEEEKLAEAAAKFEEMGYQVLSPDEQKQLAQQMLSPISPFTQMGFNYPPVSMQNDIMYRQYMNKMV